MIKTVLFAVLFLGQVLATSAFAGSEAFPKGPDARLTPGETCQHASSYRYPERIAYCQRDVASDTKKAVIADYDHTLGYRIQTMPRGQFKIDHYIPLCMGGGNDTENLWPQHETVYTITDPLEALLCQKMSEGKLKQADAIDMIKQAKNHLDQVADIIKRANSL